MNQQVIIFSDLDGTLLNHKNFSFEEILFFFKKISKKTIIIFNTSKTFSEVKKICSDYSLHNPFIVENGSAVFIPKKLKLILSKKLESQDEYYKLVLGSNLDDLIKFTNLRKCYRFISECSFLYKMNTKKLKESTGLSNSILMNSTKRDFSLPFLWNGTKDLILEFSSFVQNYNFKILKGGRFYHLIGNVDKGKAMKEILGIYSNTFDKNFISISLGDSPNDVAMLEISDYSGIVKPFSNKKLKLKKNKNVFYSTIIAPKGWEQVLKMMPPIKKIN
tara:strand:+ start:541 stop:1368 length:828 start_codon:yes stop_codon:yes gene_type:complete